MLNNLCMETEYLKAIQVIKLLDNRPNIQEWNIYARKNNLLSAVSLSCISGKRFGVLCSELRKKRKQLY